MTTLEVPARPGMIVADIYVSSLSGGEDAGPSGAAVIEMIYVPEFSLHQYR
eukprot:CAMPEP_0171536694 /NCGR_PEP_ID=MMETSP0959-20130129/17984_1 /TAXON_ID=87120 /ORGANISM="Aurantiochytrium limacinum, Strain ATCCMYA-1381" /LENGTH=50 /DNA_ID=CAMNT_0012083043 /DNA_START=51 /DNA_END=200 /DNA_ORIENTATION=+